MLEKTIVRDNFSENAEYYDIYSSLQNRCAKELIGEIDDILPERAADIGCGTGNFTELLLNKFPEADITAIDISEDMVSAAKRKIGCKAEFIVGDAEYLRFDKVFDIITSNAVFHWFSDLEKGLLNIKRALKPDGKGFFTIFGPLTYSELQLSVKSLFVDNLLIPASNFVDYSNIKSMLKKNFFSSSVKEKIYKMEYSDILELLRSIKYTGTRGDGIGNRFVWSRKKIKLLENKYRELFDSIVATYQVFFCKVKR